MNYSVSVVIIAYNTEKYIGDCLDSVLAQDLPNVELVIIDNASTDNTSAVIDAHTAGKDCVRFIRSSENLGGAIAGNLGIRQALGEYVFLMDSDDIMPPGTLRALYQCAKEHDSDVAIGRAKSIYGNKIKNLKFKFYSIPYSLPGVYRDYRECRELLISPFYWGKLFRRQLLLEHQIFMPEKFLYADLYFTTKALVHAHTISVCDALCYLWRRFDQSDSHKSITGSANQTDNFADRIQSYYDLEELFRDEEDLRCIRQYNLVRLLIPVKYVSQDSDFAQFYFEKMRHYLAFISHREIANHPYLTGKKKALCYLIKENRFGEFVEYSQSKALSKTCDRDGYCAIAEEPLPRDIPESYLRHPHQKVTGCVLTALEKQGDAYCFRCSFEAPGQSQIVFLRAILADRKGQEIFVARGKQEIPGNSVSFCIPKKVFRRLRLGIYCITAEFLINGNFCSLPLRKNAAAFWICRHPFGSSLWEFSTKSHNKTESR